MESDTRLISVNVGLPRVVMSNGEPVSTGIFKEPVVGWVMLRTLNLDRNCQADLSVQGRPSKPVYVYPSEHYEYWKRELPEIKPSWDMFGEHVTTARLFERELKSAEACGSCKGAEDSEMFHAKTQCKTVWFYFLPVVFAGCTVSPDYIAGPHAMVSEMRKMLVASGVDEDAG